MMSINRRVARWAMRFLTKPLPSYVRRIGNDPDNLKCCVKSGDVILVEGDTRISQAIKYLTQSCWSHSALYVGDELLKMGGEFAERAREACGAEADHAIIEALVDEGVTVTPLSKYINYNIRVCRPFGITPEDQKTVVHEAVAQLGFKYDMRNLLDLARYFLPSPLIPRRYRAAALHFGSGLPTEVICSSLIAKSFQRVGFPILPELEKGTAPSLRQRLTPIEKTLLGTHSEFYTGILRMRHPTLFTPRDFDLSPYFEIIKFNVVEMGAFDYRKIRWAQSDAA